MSRATLDIIGLAGQDVIHDIAVATLTQGNPRRFRLRVQLPAVQERRIQQRLHFGDIQWGRVHHTHSLDYQSDLGDACTQPP